MRNKSDVSSSTTHVTVLSHLWGSCPDYCSNVVCIPNQFSPFGELDSQNAIVCYIPQVRTQCRICATPAVIFLERRPSVVSYISTRFRRLSLRIIPRCDGTPRPPSESKMSTYLTELKAFLTSKATKTQVSLVLWLPCRALLTISETSFMAPIVERPFLKPC